MALPLFAITIIFALVAHQVYQYCLKFKLPPGPWPWPLIGNLGSVKTLRVQSYFEWSKVYGPIICVWLGPNLTVVVSNSEMAKQVLKDKDRQLAHRHRNRVSRTTGGDGVDLIWGDYGPRYVKLRKICNLELFSPKRIGDLGPIREEEIAIMVKSIFRHCQDQGKSLVLRKHLGSVAFNHVSKLAFGTRFENEEGVLSNHGLEFVSIIAREYKAALESLAEYFPFLGWLSWLKNYNAYIKHKARKQALVQRIKDEHILERQNKRASNSNSNPNHFLDALLTLKDEYDLSDETVNALLWDVMVAGMDTIAISAEWTMAQLLKNPRVQEQAHLELDRVLGPNHVMTESDISNLPYLRCVVKEALRLHPPTPIMLPHRAGSDVSIGGYEIPKGTNVFVNLWAMGRDEKVWADPLKFEPERFLEEDIDLKGQDFRLIPFGAGRRMCPAAQLSTNMLTLMLGRLLHHFSWSLPEGMQPEEMDMSGTPGLVMYMGTPLQIVPKIRSPPHA
ncbi:hypothetical protein L6164_014586 [Bauhinia variegata]|uniref:Uncharacterized protein n=1 Tax=Bauhinia variegata TaxID=167791 RepID=A0ACB9NIB7_BAUVA|nr:hypothetical protein L6164_014586 [Bauhinia variegata]